MAAGDAKITIAPDSTIEVYGPIAMYQQTWTVTVMKDVGAGFVAAVGETVTITLTATDDASYTITGSSYVTNGSGQASVTWKGDTAGLVTGHAACTLTVLGSPVTVETDGVPPNSADSRTGVVTVRLILDSPSCPVFRVDQTVSLRVTLQQHKGTVAGWSLANSSWNSAPITWAIDSGPGTLSGTNPTTLNTSRQAFIDVIGPGSPGTTVVSAAMPAWGDVDSFALSEDHVTDGGYPGGDPFTLDWLAVDVPSPPTLSVS